MPIYRIQIELDEEQGSLQLSGDENGKRLLSAVLDGEPFFGYQILSALVWQDVSLLSDAKGNKSTSPVADASLVNSEG